MTRLTDQGLEVGLFVEADEQSEAKKPQAAEAEAPKTEKPVKKASAKK